MSDEYCAVCKKSHFLVPLHGDKGGPSVCLPCAGFWHAKHGRRRKAGRVVIRALKAYTDAGGSWTDIPKLQLSAFCWDDLDPLGYMADTTSPSGEPVDLTSELLDDVIRLVHPDCHPPERQDLAQRVTQGLLALKPFVFPTPQPKAVTSVKPQPDNGSLKCRPTASTKPLRYPCKECASEIPYYYCDWCKAEWEKRCEADRVKANEQQRKWYAARRARRQRPKSCAQCGEPFTGKRKDARFCSNACRQTAHRASTLTAA
jgi:hypothetical protein